VTLFGIFLTPVFYYVIQWVNDLRRRRAPAHAVPAPGGNGVAYPPPKHVETHAAVRLDGVTASSPEEE
jgi:hypothetical protein